MRCSDTAQLFFEDVRVPAKNVIGEEGMGFTYQMLQFQEERLYAAAVGKREGWATHTRCCSSRRRDFTLQLWVRHNVSCSQKKKQNKTKKQKKNNSALHPVSSRTWSRTTCKDFLTGFSVLGSFAFDLEPLDDNGMELWQVFRSYGRK